MGEQDKTYVIKIESNLQEYIDNLVRSKKALEDEQVAQANNTRGKFQSRDEMTKNEAKLRDLQTEVKNNTKLVDLATKAAKAENGSYEQLYRTWQLAQTQLKLMPNMYAQNAKGQFILTQEYINQSQKVANLKRGLDEFGKGIHDNRLNVGSYREALQGVTSQMMMMGGPIGNVTSKLQGLFTMFTKGGVIGGAILAGVTAITEPFIAFFKYTQDGMDQLKIKTAGWRAELDVLKGTLANIGRGVTGSGGGQTNENLEKAGSQLGKFINIITLGLPQLLLGNKVMADMNAKMNEARISAEKYTTTMIELERAEIALIEPRARATYQIKQARLEYADTSKTFAERYDALKRAIELENQAADEEIAHQIKVRDATKQNLDRLKAAGIDTRADERRLAEANAKIFELQSESAGRLIRATKSMNTALKEMRDEMIAVFESYTNITVETAKGADERLKSEIDKNRINLQRQLADSKLSYEQREALKNTFIETNAMMDDTIYANERDALESRYELEKSKANNILAVGVEQETAKQNKLREIDIKFQNERDRLAADHEKNVAQRELDAFERQKKRIEDNTKAILKLDDVESQLRNDHGVKRIDDLIRLADREMAIYRQTAEYKALTDKQKAVAEAEYSLKIKQLTLARMAAQMSEIDAMGQMFNQLAGQFAENTEAYKALSIAQALIDVYKAAANAMADWTNMTVFGKIAAVGTILAEGFSLVNAIRGVKIGTKSTSTTETPPQTAVHYVSPTVPATGPTILTPTPTVGSVPALTSSVFGITADDLANVLSELPAPVVTVEDINAKTVSKRKVEVRGNI